MYFWVVEKRILCGFFLAGEADFQGEILGKKSRIFVDFFGWKTNFFLEEFFGRFFWLEKQNFCGLFWGGNQDFLVDFFRRKSGILRGIFLETFFGWKSRISVDLFEWKRGFFWLKKWILEGYFLGWKSGFFRGTL